MGKIIIHKSFLGHLKIDGTPIDDKIKELEIDNGIYDVVAGTDVNSAYYTGHYHGSKSHIVWGLHKKVTIDSTSVCHIYVKRKFSLIDIVPIIKVKYK